MQSFTFFFLLILCAMQIQAQSLTGKVMNEEARPLIDVNILNLSNGQHTHTDERGRFEMTAIEAGDSLVFSHLGHTDFGMTISELNEALLVVLESAFLQLDEVVIAREEDALNIIADLDIQQNPVNSSQDVLRRVPGLFIGQHAGGGKAEQIFLRGFDIDHGTDLAITVDGLPVNMVSHAHGQGYADLHFVIPELIGQVEFGKGPYYADQGNFATAGYVDFATKRRLENSTVKVQGGQFGTHRLLGMFQVLDREKHSAYFASEYQASDGPFNSPQDFNRINLFGKYSGSTDHFNRYGISASYFRSSWDASGQIPIRSVRDGSIGRFGAIDDTEGGQTSRINLRLNYDQFIDANSSIKNTIYFSRYDFELYSNFTFFLEDSINGDQIRQKEQRSIFGLSSIYQRNFFTDKISAEWQTGVSLRSDLVGDNELSRSANRTETLENIQLGDVTETNIGAFSSLRIKRNKWTFQPSVRVDYFNFRYLDALLTEYNPQSAAKSFISPKLRISYDILPELQLYSRTGRGFHSNDSRVVTSQQGRSILPAAYGTDAGLVWKPFDKLMLNTAYWYLFLEQEFVYVGDAGIVEPSGRTNRQGMELSARYQAFDWLYLSLDANYTHARSSGEANGQDYIPLAAGFSLLSRISVDHPIGLHADLELRTLADRPANEDYSIVAEGYTVVDLNLGYDWRQLGFGIQIQNLFNVKWNEAQFATESRLQNEQEAVEELHFTPGTPFFLQAMVEYRF